MQRISRNALWILLILTGATTIFFGWFEGLSVAAGGAVAWLNFHWMSTDIARVLNLSGGNHQERRSPPSIGRYVGRLLLILAFLFAIIHFSFLSLIGAFAGLSIYVLSGLLEAILVAVSEYSPKK